MQTVFVFNSIYQSLKEYKINRILYMDYGGSNLKLVNLLLYLSIFVLIICGMLFVKQNRYDSVSNILEDVYEKPVIIYSSNFKRAYINHEESNVKDMDRLSMECTSKLKDYGFLSNHLKIEDADVDPYTLSSKYIDNYMKRGKKYILIDIIRNKSSHGEKFVIDDISYCPISIIISKNSDCYDNSLLFAGRIKSIIESKYTNMKIQIKQVEEEYNQSRGYIGFMLEIGDSANTYDEAKNSISIFCEGFKAAANYK